MDGQTTALPRRVLGIDPGLAVSGYCLVDERGSGGHLVHCGALRSTAKQPRAERLYRIYGLVMALVAEYRPVELAIEQQFVAENVKSAMAIGEARAAAMVAAAAAGIPVYEFTPTAVKESVTGWGGAPKEQVAQMVAIHLGVTEVPGPLDVSDAAAIALTRLAEARLEEAMARMIAALHGVVTHFDVDTATAWIDVHGVSYEVRVPAFASEWVASRERAADEAQDETTVYTYYHVSERNPAPLLIAFQHRAERDFFRKFIEVPDVGPTKAVRALTKPVSEIARWIESSDVKALQSLPGIGARLSQTIVAQLAGKLTQEALLRDGTEAAPAPVADSEGIRDDAIEALVSLQYSRRDAERAVEQAVASGREFAALEDLLRAILEHQAPADAAAEPAR